MLKSIDVLIGLSVVMLIVSMAVTVITQAVINLFQSRGRYLREGIGQLLQKIDPSLEPEVSGQIAHAVLMHPLIRGPRGLGTVIHREELIGTLLELAGGGKATAQLGSAAAERLRKALELSGLSDPQKTLSDIRTAALEIETKAPELANHVRADLAILKTASSDFVATVHFWFDSTMDRVSERFTSSIRLVTFGTAIIVVLILQLDTVGLVNRLTMDDAMRQALTVQAQAIAKTQIDPTGTKTDAAQQYSQALEQTGIVAPPHSAHQWMDNWRNVNPLGVCISVFLLTLGAPFWYDMLKKLLNLRSVLADKDDQQRRQRQKTSAIPKEVKAP